MYPHERSLVEEMKGRDFVLVGVNSDDPEKARQAVIDNALNWRSFRNTREDGSQVADDWFIAGWPTILILDGERKIHYRGHDGDEAMRVARELVAKGE